MEIWTLVKAEIRNRKGVFIGFGILTTLIVVSILTMLGVSNNCNASIDRAFETIDKGVMLASYGYDKFSPELEKKLEENEMVDHIDINDMVVGINVKCNDYEDGNGYYCLKYFDSLPVYNKEENGFINFREGKNNTLVKKEIDKSDYELKKGEIYIPYGCKNEFKCKAGDKIKIDFHMESREFTIRGFVQEPYMGSSIIGIKTVFLSDEDYDYLYDCIKSNIKTEDDYWSLGNIVYIYPSEKADKSSDKFLRKLNLETKVNDIAENVMTRETAQHYTGIFINIIMAVIIGFAILLTAIFLIVAGHNISTEMEIDYTNLGILKAEGFTNTAIRKVYLIEYLLVQLAGIIVGFILSIPCERWLSKIFFGMTAVLPLKKIPVLEGIMITVILFAVTGIYIFIFSGKVTKTTPVKAITKGKNDYYFISRLNAPITKKGLGFTLGLRQITSAPKRYISIFIVSTILIYMVVSVELMSNYIESRNALTSMGEPFLDIEFSYQNSDASWSVEDIENIIKKHTEIDGRCYKSHNYVSINGENVMCVTKAYPEELSSTYKGHEVRYDNEIVITEQVANLMDIKIGDTVKLGRGKVTEEYIVSGIFQTMNDTGKAISVSLDGLSRLKEDPSKKYNINQLGMYGVVLKDSSVAEEIVNEVKDKYGDEINIQSNNYEKVMDNITDSFYMAADASKYFIYILTFIFAFVTVAMVFSKTFVQERTDIGINRAIGFSVGRIRRQFAMRFMIIGLISAVFGMVLSRLYSGQMLELVFSMFGVPHMELDYTFISFIRPVIIFTVFYLIFGFVASRKVKKVSARELIKE
ncbi:MAG: ABC transporter permease [Lachnospiraceae bacterium]|nr:ABC transporter permease [Lachnospiraceae bacterium]